MKALPHDAEMEADVLGGLILRPELMERVTLEVDDFYDPRNRAVFAAMRNLEAKHVPLDTDLIAAELDKAGKLDAVGGYAYLGEVALRVPVPDSVLHYCEVVRTHRQTRRAILDVAELLDRMRQGELQGAGAVGALVDLANRMSTSLPVHEAKSMGRLVTEEYVAIMRDIDRLAAGQQLQVGLPTGLTKLDALLGGLPLGLLTILCGRPGNGKTTVAQTFLRASDTQTSGTALLYSYEDSAQSFAQREMAATCGVATQTIRSRRFTRHEMSLVGQQGNRASNRRGIIVQASGMTVEELCRDVRRRRAVAKVEGRREGDLVIVDYLQRLPWDPKMRYDQALGSMCNALVDLAAQEGIAVVAGSQLNRQLEGRETKTPRLSDLRDSGRLEELAKVVLAVHRPAKYDTAAPRTLLEIHVLKNHNGEADVHAAAHWNLETHLITDAKDDR